MRQLRRRAAELERELGRAQTDARRAQSDARRESRLREDAAAEGTTLAPRDSVTLRQRAWPLLEMMKRSIGEKADIVWGV